MNQDIRQTQVYKNLLAAYQNNLKPPKGETPPIERQMIVITQMLSRYELPNDLELFLTVMADAYLAQQAKEQGLIDEISKGH